MRLIASLVAALLLAVGADAAERSVFVHLFEWRWQDVARECEQVLGPAGFSAVQVSPPNEHVDHRSGRLAVPYAWWARYQPVTFDLVSRSGSREEFIDMVERCGRVGVGIYVDAVLNHMADQVGVGIAGTPFDREKRAYRDLRDEHFNPFCKIAGPDYRASDRPGENETRAERLRRCQLLDLPDLNNGHPAVRALHRAYLQDLLDIGVAGFRIDAAKHMYPEDIRAVLESLEGDFYVFQEVVDTRGEPVGVFDYVANGQVTEFLYSKRLGEAFAAGDLRTLQTLDESGGLLDSGSAVVFVDNHDNQRGHGMSALTTHRDGRRYDLASILLLAWPYGTPKLMSSYEWGGVDDSRGPPRDGEGNTLAVFDADGVADCGGENWVCEHRRFELLRMVDFRNRAGSAGASEVTHWWSNGPAAAFGLRGRDGGFAFVAVNTDTRSALETRAQTGLPEGRYCNLLPAGLRGTLIAAGGDGRLRVPGCAGGEVSVDAEGMLEFELAPEQALVIDRERRSREPALSGFAGAPGRAGPIPAEPHGPP